MNFGARRLSINLIMNITGVITLIASIFVFGLKGLSAEMGIGIAGSTIPLFIANLDKLKNFKMLGISAEVGMVVNEANATISHLKSVTQTLMAASINSLINEGRPAEIPSEKDYGLFDSFLKLKEEIGINDAETNRLICKFIHWQLWDVLLGIFQNLSMSKNKKIIDEFSWLTINGRDSCPDIPKFQELLMTVDDTEVQADLDFILEFYEKYKKHLDT